MTKIAVIGTVGVPACYGGFETLAENLALFNQRLATPHDLTIVCSGKAYSHHPDHFAGAKLSYIPLSANGAQAIPYDIWSLLRVCRQRPDVILLLGHAGAYVLPLLRLFTRARFVTNVDGIEWKRDKWGWLTKQIIRLGEIMAARFSHEIIADNHGIADHVQSQYAKPSHVIAYGGDHAVEFEPKPIRPDLNLPQRFAFKVARIEPENNIEMVLQGFADFGELPLVVIGNWKNSTYGVDLVERFGSLRNMHLIDPIYDLQTLYDIRRSAQLYVHGHSAGGTNPSLVEVMHFGVPILAFDCAFNRHTTADAATYFKDAADLTNKLAEGTLEDGAKMREIAQDRYTWDVVGKAYFDLLSTV